MSLTVQFRSAALTAVILLVLTGTLVPVAQAQGDVAAQAANRETSMITFYGHIFGLGRGSPMPMNVEYPWGEEDLSQGFLTGACNPAVAGDPTGSGVTDCESSTLNEVWLYTTAGFVDISDNTDFDYQKVHNERGLTKDTLLDTTKDITATFYMSADAHGWPVLTCSLGGLKPYDVPEPLGCWNWDPGYLPQWTVEATIYTGVLGEYGGLANEGPDIASAVDAGSLEVLAHGVSQPQDVTSLEVAGQPTVWKFDVNLGTAERDTIPKEQDYLVRFKWYSNLGGEKVIMRPDWNVNSGELYPPTVTIPVKNAFDVESVIPQFVHGKLVVHGILNTPWGSYDVDQDSIAITVEGEKTGAVTPQRIERHSDFSVAHGGHYKPVNVTYVWDYLADNLAPDTYTVTVAATNYQGSAAAECSAKFTVLERGAPGPIEVGQCGVSTLSNEQFEEISEGAGEAASGEDEGEPASPPTLPLAAFPLVGVAGLVLNRRGRWRS